METLNKEVWKTIKQFEDTYEVSNFGRVRSKDRTVIHPVTGINHRKGKVLSDRPAGNIGQYRVVALYKNGIRFNKLVHRLVACTFF